MHMSMDCSENPNIYRMRSSDPAERNGLPACHIFLWSLNLTQVFVFSLADGPRKSPLRRSTSRHHALTVKVHPVCVTTVSFLGTLVIVFLSSVPQLVSSSRLLLVFTSVSPTHPGLEILSKGLNSFSSQPSLPLVFMFSVLNIVV